jgi:hypothetical protein
MTGSTEASAGIPKDADKIVVGVWMLEPGEDVVVARRVRKVDEGDNELMHAQVASSFFEVGGFLEKRGRSLCL